MQKLLKQPRAHSVGSSARPLLLSVVGCIVRVTCGSSDLTDVLVKAYGGMRCRSAAASDLNYVVRRSGVSGICWISRPGQLARRTTDDSEFMFRFEKELTIKLQHRRRDLYFLHAAALEFDGKGILLVAPSGGGKSTLA